MRRRTYLMPASMMLSAASLVILPVSGTDARAAAKWHHTGTPEASEPTDPRIRVVRANETARVQPERSSYFNAIQQYAWVEGALFQVYTAPGQISDIILQEGEELVGPGPVASGDTARWIIGDTISGSAARRRVHILVKPTRADIMTNLVINTNLRTYHLELRSTTSTYMAAVSWTYPEGSLIALRGSASVPAASETPTVGIDPAALNFRYRISGDRPEWRPVRVFDDGRQVFVEFAVNIATGEMPPLFVTGADGAAELVNYRVQGRFIIVDRLFDRAELRLGAGKAAKKVRIEHDRKRRRPS